MKHPEAGEAYLGFGARGGTLNLSPSGDLREAAGAGIGDTVSVAITPSDEQLEPGVPADLERG